MQRFFSELQRRKVLRVASGYVVAGWNVPNLPPGSLGYVNAIGILAIIPTSLWLAPIGARLAHGLSRRTLEIAFGCFLLLVGLRFLAGLAFG